MQEVMVARPVDLIGALLADKRSENTRRTYEKDLRHFFKTMTGQEPTPELVYQFLSLSKQEALQVAMRYKAKLMERYTEWSVNRKLTALRSLVAYANKIGLVSWRLEIEGEKVKPYRDVSGIPADQVMKMLAVPDRSTLKGKRDYAILCLLWSNALRRSEVHHLNVEDFDPEAKTLAVLGKGRGTQKEIVSLSTKTAEAIADWLEARGDCKPDDPLFIVIGRPYTGQRLSTTSIYKLVDETAKAAGIKKQMSPHRMRHSAITAALEATNGNVTAVQKLSRHRKVETVLIYEDRRQDKQREISEMLSNFEGVMV
ncbi:tyrosine-type recombinase/integrase [Saccharococcus caldoxylosilyticus]|uniref:tyrosine-type recombinase/integrase n=1 Tax=Saccharococcus caldoxylosilyticus TaxID=81408 RepID=UPI001FCB1085|nr:tyrosine-type recombinase/integrase [Parageobacillus caldoxylosilyticus]